MTLLVSKNDNGSSKVCDSKEARKKDIIINIKIGSRKKLSREYLQTEAKIVILYVVYVLVIVCGEPLEENIRFAIQLSVYLLLARGRRRLRLDAMAPKLLLRVAAHLRRPIQTIGLLNWLCLTSGPEERMILALVVGAQLR